MDPSWAVAGGKPGPAPGTASPLPDLASGLARQRFHGLHAPHLVPVQDDPGQSCLGVIVLRHGLYWLYQGKQTELGLTRTVALLSAWQFPSLPWTSAHHQSLVTVCHLVPKTYMDPLMVLASP